MLKLQSSEPEWLGNIPSKSRKDKRPFLLKGVRVAFHPIDDDAFEEGQKAMLAVLRSETPNQGAALKAGQNALLRRGIAAWEGIGDPSGKPLPVTPDTIDAVLRDPRLRAPMADVYVAPFLLWDAEGNGSAG